MSKIFEIVVFTASCKEYALPVIDAIDTHSTVSYKLWRKHCDLYNGSYIKDLSRLGRPLDKIVMIDNA
jgi:RNA polymerase II subunit A small phosphatase-like protein